MLFRIVFAYLLLFAQVLFGATPLDFSKYRFGYNNRDNFEAIVKDLSTEFGQPVSTAYGTTLEARKDRIVISESHMDKYLQGTDDPKEREAIARFILAHEFFHVALKHVHTGDQFNFPKEIQISGPYADARRQMERQVDYLAAKYLIKLGLPTEPIQRLFTSHPEFHGGDDYPTAKDRAEIVLSARQSGIDESHFNHQAIKCTFLLASLIAKLP